MSNLQLRQARVIDPSSGLDQVQDLFLQGGTLVAMGAAPAGFIAHDIIDAAGCIASPSWVDLYGGFNTTPAEQVIDAAQEAEVCARAGITHVCCPPDRGLMADEATTVSQFLQNQTSWLVQASVAGALTKATAGKDLSELAAMKKAGCRWVSNGDSPLSDWHHLRLALSYAAGLGLSVGLQPTEASLNRGCVHEGEVSMRLGLPGIPDFAESIAIASILQLTASLKLPIHFHKLSSAVGVELIAAAQQNGQPVTADVAVAHLHLCDHDLYIYNPNAYVIPPLRGEADRQALRRALADGVINAVCSDHQPMSIIDKSQPFAGCTPGVSTWETLLPLTLSALGGDVVKTVARLSTEPARILGLTEVGCLTLNAPVNLCIWDPEAIWRVVPDQLASQGKNTPFGGWLMNGAVRATFLNGHMVYRA